MALRKAIKRFYLSFQWRILLPTLGLMWLVIGVLAVYQYQREETVRAQAIRNQLDLINVNVIDAYDSGSNLKEYIGFIKQFYDNTFYSGLRISVYTHEGELVANSGRVIPFTYGKKGSVTKPADAKDKHIIHEDSMPSDRNNFYYSSRSSFDGKLFVLTAMPYTKSIAVNLSTRNGIWWVILSMALVASLLVYWLIHHMSRSVRLLSAFAGDVADGRSFSHYEEFPHDEFGKISLRLVQLYNEKDKALKLREHEHEVAMNAIVEKHKLKREMSNNISHELKTPVGIVKGYLDTIMAQEDMDADTMRYFIGRAQPNVDRLCSLLNDLSMITRLEDGAKQISVEKIDYHNLVFAVADDFRIAGQCDWMTFEIDIPLNTYVRGNLNLLLGMLHNLVRNAKRHSQGTEMGVKLLGETDRFYIFTFYDNGVGVPEESIPCLFDRFYRVDKGRSRKNGDSGLGLTIVQDTVVSLGGAISVKNRSTGGLEFTYSLPKWNAPK